MIDHERLKQILTYNPETGVFCWAEKLNRRIVVGAPAGTVNGHGYIIITINRFRYRAHRLAWFYVYGVWPQNDIDHRNCKRNDNRIENLRDVTTAENIQNQIVAHKRNRSGFLGVTERRYGFNARIHAHGVTHDLGVFKTPEAAHEAYVLAKRKFHVKSTL